MTTEPADRSKAVTVLVESLKLYVGVSTFAIAGLLTYFSRVGDQTNIGFLLMAFVSFLLATVASLWNINQLVTLVHNGKADVYESWSKSMNRLAIAFFFLGILSGSAYIYRSTPNKDARTTSSIESGVVVDGMKVSIGNDVKTKVVLKKDSTGLIIEIRINE